ncbi:glycosyltransferase family 2 protein [Haliea sp. E17]|uniref:glycosyltransferase family 2 protein n=1 Tax=Haliea sp. E17 TaxID=3401576 RepID=UPI003AAB9D25
MSITLITPVWNNAGTVADCIRSINRQTVKCQHIIVDGGSTDGTQDVIERERAEGSTFISEPDRGMYDAINKGIALAEGEIVGVLNSDDFYPTDDALELVEKAFEKPEVSASYGDLYYVDRENPEKVVRNWRSGEYQPKKFYNGWMPPHPTFFLRRELYKRHGGYRLDLGSAADYELMLRMLLKHDTTAAYVPRVLVHMRTAGMSNASFKNRVRANRSDRKAWAVNEIKPKPWTLLAKPLGKVGQWLG